MHEQHTGEVYIPFFSFSNILRPLKMHPYVHRHTQDVTSTSDLVSDKSDFVTDKSDFVTYERYGQIFYER